MTRTVLVTGVSSGIGLAQAQLFLENGWRVYGVDRSEKPSLTGDFYFLQQDLTLGLQPVFAWCSQVDVFCNTAGVLDDYKPLLEQTAQEIQEIFEINYVTPVELTRYYLTQMLKKQSGIIINMCWSCLHFFQACSGRIYQTVGTGLCGAGSAGFWDCTGRS